MEYLLLVLSYFVGTIPSGLIFSKIAGYGDIRNIGSGNVGATNVLRTGNKTIAFLTLLFDAFKGAFVVFLCKTYAEPLLFFASFLTVMGHIFPVWLKFKGGKGIATSLGIFLALSFWLGLSLLFIWLIVSRLFKISSLSALVATCCSPILGYLMFPYSDFRKNLLLFSICLSLVILWAHRSNLKRILQGSESKIDF